MRGRVGFDGDYRGEGCAACHVSYAEDGLSESRDRSIPRGEPGHARTHTMVRNPETQTCTTCHYGEFSRPFDWDEFWPLIRHGKGQVPSRR